MVQRDQRGVFRKTPLALAVSLAVANGGALAQEETQTTAQPADERAVEEVVVACWFEGGTATCGLRESLQASMELKRTRDGVVDAITAEDIGNFPDTNLAESLQRVTGVSIDRERGEGARVTVRGFGPDFNLVLLNGRQMPTTSGLGRSFDFGDLASEGVAAVEIHKSGRADMPTGGVGSTINIRTAQPLDAPRHALPRRAERPARPFGGRRHLHAGDVGAVLQHLPRRHRGHRPFGGAAEPRKRRQHGQRRRLAHLPRRETQQLGRRRRQRRVGRYSPSLRPQPAEPPGAGRPLLSAAGHRLRAGGVRTHAHQRPTHAAMAGERGCGRDFGLHLLRVGAGAHLQQSFGVVQFRRPADGVDRWPAGVAAGVRRELGEQRLLHGRRPGRLAHQQPRRGLEFCFGT